MDFEWKQRILFMFVVVPVSVALASVIPSPLDPGAQSVVNLNDQLGSQNYNGILWPRDPIKAKILQEFQQRQQLSNVNHQLNQQRQCQQQQPEPQVPNCETTVPKDGIPAEFDGRRKWTSCPSLWEIRDQSSCSSWAAAVASVLTDRFCIASKGTKQFRISDQDLLSCAGEFAQAEKDVVACLKVDLSKLLKYLSESGVVTGGYWLASDGCKPSLLAPCDHSLKNGEFSCDRFPSMESLKCHKTCHNPVYKYEYKDDKKYVKNYCLVAKNDMESIQAEILTNGPVLAVMNLYEDFYEYNPTASEVYTNDKKGEAFATDHYVKIVGWGSQAQTNGSSVDYWIVSNSFNYLWGDGGFFKIHRGGNDPELGANISDQVYSIVPDKSQI